MSDDDAKTKGANGIGEPVDGGAPKVSGTDGPKARCRLRPPSKMPIPLPAKRQQPHRDPAWNVPFANENDAV